MKIRIGHIIATGSNKQIFSHTFWSLVGAVVSKLLVLASAMIAARILGKEMYGELGIIRSTILMVVSLAAFSIGSTASKYIAENRDTDLNKTIDVYLVSNCFSGLIAVVASLFILIFAPYIAENSLESPHLVNPIRVGSLILFFSILNGAQSGILAGFEDFKKIAISNVIKALFQSFFLIYGSYKFGLMGGILGFGLSYFIVWLYNLFLVKNHIKKINISLKLRLHHLNWEKFSILWKFSLPSALSSMMMIPAIWWTKTLLVRESGFQAMASFDVAEQWRTQILFIPGVLAQIMLPVLANNKSKNKENFIATVKTNLFLNLSISTILALIIFFTGEIILSGYGKEFRNVFPLHILAVSGVLISVTNVVNPIIMTLDKMWVGVLINVVWVIVYVILSYILLNQGYAENGLSLAVLISYCISLVVSFLYVKKLYYSEEFQNLIP